ncbi:MAG: response regulator [Opitutaceae bacterium]|nr:response regulator [Opitutaceae bacterium]
MASRASTAQKKAPAARRKKRPAASSRPAGTTKRKRARRTRAPAAAAEPPSGPTRPPGLTLPAQALETQDAILELTHALFAAIDRVGRIHTCSSAWAECLHLSREQIVGRELPALLDPVDRARWDHWLNRILAGHVEEELSLRFAANGRGQVWLAVRPRLSPSRETIHLVARDVTAEKLTADHPPPADLVLDEIEEGVLVADATRAGFPVVSVNAGFTRLTGYSAADAVNRSLAFVAGAGTAIDALEHAISACVDGRRSATDLCLARKDGSPFWVRMRLRPVTDASGRVRQVVAVLVDTTERHMVVDALREKNLALTEALESLQKTKEAIVQRERMHALGKMASGIVHDFNNLLAPILGFTELLLTIPDLIKDTEKVQLYLQKIRTAANDGAAVVSRLREFYRSRTDIEPAHEFFVQSAIQEVLEFTRHRWKNEAQAQGNHFDLVVDLQETPAIHGYESEIRQALTNVVLNAVDAMPDGGTLRVRSYQVGHWVCLQVADTGHGMSEEVRRRCFEPFFTTKGKAGTGLGLSIVFGIIERHGGRVDLHSEEGHGTTFTFWLPIERAGDFAGGEDPVAPATPNSEEGRALRVLVVDDEDLLLEIVSLNLQQMGHTVDCFTDPKQAIERFYKQHYDLVITDRAMPGMSGDQFAARVRELHPETPVVLLTGFAHIIRQNGEKPANIDEVLSKPLSQQTLRDLMARHGGRTTVAG